MLWNFMTFHLKKRRERAAEAISLKKNKQPLDKKEKKKKKVDDDLPEVDQNTSKDVRHRKVANK
jgi:hypothetical protein